MMKGVTKWILISGILLFLISGVSAITTSTVVIDPSGSLVPGTSVSISFRVDATDFDGDNEIFLTTDLADPVWSYTIFINDVEGFSDQSGSKTVSVSGWLLEYPSGDEVSLRVTLKGKSPDVTQSSEKILFRVQELDSKGNPISSQTTEYKTTVVNTAEISQSISTKRAELQSFRSQIDEKAAIGVDTANAEIKYSDAKSKIDAAAALPSTEYTNALAYLNTAADLIKDGNTALDKSWAEREVATAQIPISNVDRVIAWFKGNASTSSNAELPPIISKREIAVSYISAANDQIASGQYSLARSKAAEAYAKGNESYTDALILQKKVSSGFNLGAIFSSGVLTIIAVVVVIGLIAAGVIMYRKRSSWDELG